MPKESGWVTINGVHVFIDNSGKISKGPAKFIGSTVNDLPSSGKSAADRKAELKAKYGSKSETDETKRKTAANGNHRSQTARGPVKGPAPGTENPESTPKPKTIPERREATATDILGVNGSDPNGVYLLEEMRNEIMGKAISTGKLSKADQKKLDLIDQELDDSPWQEFRTFTGVGGGPDSGRLMGDARPSPTPGEKMGDYMKRTGSTFGSSSRTRGRGSSSSSDSSVEKTGFSHVDKLNAKVAELEALEGKSATAKNIRAAMDRSVDKSMSIGGQTTLKNKFGESVTVSESRGLYGGAAGLQASIQHSDGSVSMVYASTASDLSKRINDRNAHYNAPDNKVPSNTGNPAFDGATTHIIKKIK